MATASFLQFSEVSHQTSGASVAHMCIPDAWGLCYVCIAELHVPSPAPLSGFHQDSIPAYTLFWAYIDSALDPPSTQQENYGFAQFSQQHQHGQVCPPAPPLPLHGLHTNIVIDISNPLPPTITSPINVAVLHHFLQFHPQKQLVAFLIRGFLEGFDIGYRGVITHSSPNNLLSARKNPESVTKAIKKELLLGHTSGPFETAPFPITHCSPLGAVQKSDGSTRIILDLSSPRSQSVNDGISKNEFSVSYSRLDDALKMLLRLGPECFLAKLDLAHAFRNLPVRPQDWPLLCYKWGGKFFVDTRLAFVFRSSPFIFNTFAEALHWILLNIVGIAFLLHYLDDFLILNPSEEGCSQDMESMKNFCKLLGVPLNEKKIFGPSRVLVYLGIEINTVTMTVRLPDDKLWELKALLLEWKRKKKCTKRSLLSLIGKLAFAARIVKPGRLFLRRLIDLSTKVDGLNKYITLNAEARADIAWWLDFIPTWSGSAFIQHSPVTADSLSLYSDASGIGFGAYFDTHWFAIPWPQQYRGYDIGFRELFAITAAIFTWGDDLAGKQILFFTDNKNAVDLWHSGTSSDKDLMRLLRALFLFCANHQINLFIKHLPGKNNPIADSLSRLLLQRFRQLHPTADSHPTEVNPAIWTI